MNYKILLYFFLLCFLSVQSCKKEPKIKDDQENTEEHPTILACDVNTPVFSIDVNSSDSFADLVEDLARNIVLLGKNSILKYDYKGNLLWNKPFTTIGKPQNIIQANGDNYFTTNSTIDVTSHKPYQIYSDYKETLRLTSYFRGRQFLLSSCQQFYDQTNKSRGETADSFVFAPLPVNKSKCFLNKINKEGKLLWTKTFDGNYFHGKSICKTDDGNYVLLTYKMSGFYQTAEFDQYGVFQDTIKAPIDQNTITVYKLDKDGNTLWSKMITGVIQSGIAPELDMDFSNAFNIVSIQNNLFIQASKQLFVLDANGNSIKTMRPYGTDCTSIAYGLTSGNNKVYSTGYYYSGTGFNYAISYDANANPIEQSLSESNFGLSFNTLAMSDGIVYERGTMVSKVNMSDVNIWRISDGNIQCLNKTCLEGLIYVTKTNNLLKLVKTNRDGTHQ